MFEENPWINHFWFVCFFVVGVCVCVKGISVGLLNGVRILIHLCYLNQFALVGTLKVALAKFWTIVGCQVAVAGFLYCMHFNRSIMHLSVVLSYFQLLPSNCTKQICGEKKPIWSVLYIIIYIHNITNQPLVSKFWGWLGMGRSHVFPCRNVPMFIWIYS